MALIGTMATLRGQLARTEGFATALAYADELLRAGSPAQLRVKALAMGEVKKTELAGGVFVMEQAYESKVRAEGFFESHRKYIDVQIVLEGQETMEIADITTIAVREPYNAEKDLIVYGDHPAASWLRIYPGQAAVFFPEDVHMPSLRLGAEAVAMRKCVVKVPVGA